MFVLPPCNLDDRNPRPDSNARENSQFYPQRTTLVHINLHNLLAVPHDFGHIELDAFTAWELGVGWGAVKMMEYFELKFVGCAS